MDADGPVSAKAGGKRRATLEPDEAWSLFVNLRFTQLAEDVLGLEVPREQTVRQFKQQLAGLRPELASKQLKLIYLGRVLTDGIVLYPWLDALLERQAKQSDRMAESLLEAVVKLDSEASSSSRDRSAPGRSAATAIWINCSVGEAVDEASSPVAKEDSTTAAPLTGFDRLREAGFSEEDISHIREQFRAQRTDADVETSNVVDDQDEHIRALEESWLEGLGNQEASPDAGSDEYMVLLKGICVGFFFPIAPLFWFKTNLFSRQMQMGIVAGTCFNLGFGIVRLFS